MRKFFLTLCLSMASMSLFAAERIVSLDSHFNSLTVSAGANVVYVADGSAGSVTISGPDDKINNVEVKISHGTLFIAPKKSNNRGRNGDTIKGVTIRLRGNAVTRIEASSGAEVKSTSPIAAGTEQGTINVSSGAEVKLQFLHVSSLNATATSGGEIEIENLVTGHATATATSGGDVELSGTATELSANATSGGSVDTSGLKVSGKVSANKSSGGSVKVRNK
ncbi:MAG: DUF2807 domain-containing protein [Duncaniella sp.]|nr:DUF2807 domain-containing protein [Duncaniella sp.]